MTITQPTVLVLIGITGDLAGRKLVPGIANLAADGRLGDKFRFIGTSRRTLSVKEALGENSNDYLKSVTTTYQLDPTKAEDFEQFKTYIGDLAAKLGEDAKIIFYLSVPPEAMDDVIEQLGNSGFNQHKDVSLMLEKPFGQNLESAKALMGKITSYFREDQLFLIDHYLAKEMTQSLTILKDDNRWLSADWSNQHIKHINIKIYEDIGVEGRADFYEQTGALKDVLQSHALQLTATTLIPAIANLAAGTLPKRRLEMLKSLRLDQSNDAAIIRGQYQTYKTEVGNPISSVETFVSLPLISDLPLWENVTINVATGKKLNQKLTEVEIIFKVSRRLLIQIEPEQFVSYDMSLKAAGYDSVAHTTSLKYNNEGQGIEAYQRLFYDALRGSHELFVGVEEIFEQWRIIEPVMERWQLSDDDLISYEAAQDPANIKQ